MKNKLVSLLEVVSPLFLVVGDLGLFFKETMFVGYLLFALGAVLGLVVAAVKSRIDIYERFHLLTSIVGLVILGFFVFTGIIYRIIVVLLVLFVVDFLIIIMDLRKTPSRKLGKSSNDSEPKDRMNNKVKDKTYEKFNEQKLYDELENIKDEFSHVQIYEDGNAGDIEDLSLKKQAEEIKSELNDAVVVQDPKEGRYFYKETGKMFHIKGCVALQRVNKKEIKSSNSRTELLAKGYKACKVCNS